MEVLGGKTTLPEAFKAANGVLQGAVAGIAEVINVPGMVNVDFADVCTLMSENGMAMMGAASASGEDRARRAAEQAIASPLLEDVDLSGARGVLVTSSSNLTLEELHEVMNCFQFAASEATVIVGSVFDEAMGDEMRVTIVATGLGAPLARKQPKPVLAYEKQLRTGTHDAPMVNYNELDMPAVIRTGRHREAVEAMKQSGVDPLDIPLDLILSFRFEVMFQCTDKTFYGHERCPQIVEGNIGEPFDLGIDGFEVPDQSVSFRLRLTLPPPCLGIFKLPLDRREQPCQPPFDKKVVRPGFQHFHGAFLPNSAGDDDKG
jgi:hypothetical protein